MPIAQFVFSEASPSSPGTAASSQSVTNTQGWPAGVAGPLDDYDSISVIAELVGAAGGTLSVYLQSSPDGGQNWYDVIAWPQLSAGAPAVKYSSPVSQSTTTTTTTVVGKNLAPALNPSSGGAVVNGAFSDRFRLVMVAGSGTTLGASVVVRLCPQRSRVRELGD